MKSRFFFFTYASANIGLIAYGVMALLQPGILLELFSNHVYQFPVEATNAITYLSGLYRLLGYLNIIPGMLGLLILYRYWSRRGSWDLQMVVTATSFSYLGPVVFDNTVGRIGFFEILEHVLFGLVLIAGLLMILEARRFSPSSLPASSIEAGLGKSS